MTIKSKKKFKIYEEPKIEDQVQFKDPNLKTKKVKSGKIERNMKWVRTFLGQQCPKSEP